MKLYAFLYNPMIHESGYVTMSIHRTRKGAEKALEWHRKQEQEEWINACGELAAYWAEFKVWRIEEITLQD
jgi:hypothetical protein